MPGRARKFVVGNWKMNGSRAGNAALLDGLKQALPFAADVAVCAPAPFIDDVSRSLAGSGIGWGAQDCSSHDAGAFTGEFSARMLAELGCSVVIVGHSERRAQHGESDGLVAAKARRAIDAGLVPIVCVGETLAERDAGRTEEVVDRQLAAVTDLLGNDIARTVLAYEPVWAIGSGRTATPDQAQAVHARLRRALGAAGASVRILYGGSVKD
ncbi:MAG TPA: triose-phosphate isomerase, partial [Caldimonas sp.]|nr:triose-phosphate isomerase [Caldimonas sp.]